MDDVVFMVRGRTRAICQQYLDRVCTLLGATATMKPSDTLPPGWVARAVLHKAETDAAEPLAQ